MDTQRPPVITYSTHWKFPAQVSEDSAIQRMRAHGWICHEIGDDNVGYSYVLGGSGVKAVVHEQISDANGLVVKTRKHDLMNQLSRTLVPGTTCIIHEIGSHPSSAAEEQHRQADIRGVTSYSIVLQRGSDPHAIDNLAMVAEDLENGRPLERIRNHYTGSRIVLV